MKNIVRENKLLFAAYLLIALFFFAFLLWQGKKESHLVLSGFHTGWLDTIMKLITFMGNGLFMVFAGVLLLFRRIRSGLIILSSFLASALAAQLLKHLVFPEQLRPLAWFHKLGTEIYKVDGIVYHSSFSFPSGHSTTAFALFFGLAFMVKNQVLKLFFLFLAVITAYSRVYLSQHFLGDIIAGSLLGIVSAIVFETIFSRIGAEWASHGLISFIRRRNA
ncbi:MAG: phosphatase PAP2 family protein [Bacteroidales bacterium]|nr:phosphatase PAP2 family protein [Bacteroidales bacterium]MCB9013883.1 phosphatase PAP2 family protein [Bacteroidales bacterium]